MENLTAADVAAVTRSNGSYVLGGGGWGGGSFGGGGAGGRW